MLALALVDGPVLPLLTFHLVPALLLFRSAAMGNYPGGPIGLVLVIWECVYWAALASIPYHDRLDRLLQGAVSHGGTGAGKPGSMPDHIEEPTCEFNEGEREDISHSPLGLQEVRGQYSKYVDSCRN